MRLAVIPGILLAFVACGGSDNSSPTEAPMNITANAIASPKGSSNIAIPTGGRVHYFNKDVTPHQIVATGAGCSVLSTDGAIPPNGDQLRPTMNSAANCTLTDSANSGITAFVNVTAPPPGSSGGGGGSGY